MGQSGAKFGGVSFEWVGHATVRIEHEDYVVYIDPWGPVVDGEPEDGNLVLVSHSDYGHYDPEAIGRVSEEGATVLVYEKVRTHDIGNGLNLIEIGYEDFDRIDGVEIETVPAYNKPGGEHTAVSGQPYHPEGQVVGFLIRIGDVRIYFAGDTDFLDKHRGIETDVFLPPIGGVYTMDAREATEFARAIEPELVLPVHYNHPRFPELEADADSFKEELEKDGIEAEVF